jgi:hypothetical protein
MSPQPCATVMAALALSRARRRPKVDYRIPLGLTVIGMTKFGPIPSCVRILRWRRMARSTALSRWLSYESSWQCRQASSSFTKCNRPTRTPGTQKPLSRAPKMARRFVVKNAVQVPDCLGGQWPITSSLRISRSVRTTRFSAALDGQKTAARSLVIRNSSITTRPPPQASCA